MDLGKFLSMFREECLYFARLRELDDSWEGAHSAALAVYPNLNQRGLKRLYDANSENIAVSCWHEGSDESVAMWRLYTDGSDGVAIKTTVGSLKESLYENRFMLRIARVQYIGDSEYPIPCSDRPPDGLEAAYCKRLVYQHEREIRAALMPVRSPDDPVAPPDLLHGVRIRVKLTSLVDRVVVSPRFPDFAVPVVEDALSRAGMAVPVEASALKQMPLDL